MKLIIGVVDRSVKTGNANKSRFELKSNKVYIFVKTYSFYFRFNHLLLLCADLSRLIFLELFLLITTEQSKLPAFLISTLQLS